MTVRISLYLSLIVLTVRPFVVLAQSELTTLRAAPAVALWDISAKGLSIRQLRVAIRNVGELEAQKISVSIVTADGLSVHLSGPRELAPHQLQNYTYRSPIRVMRAGKLTIVCSCKNCRKFIPS